MINVVCSTWTALFNRFLSSPTNSAWKYYFVFIVVLVATIANIWFFYPETAGRSLEAIQVGRRQPEEGVGKADTTLRILTLKELFDGPGAVSDLVNQELAVHPEALVLDKKGDADDEQLEYAKQ